MSVQEDIILRITADLQSALNDLKKLGAEAKKTGKGMKGAGDDAKTAGGGLSGLMDKFKSMKKEVLLAGATVAGFGIILKQSFDFAKHGAQVTQLTESFATMTGQVTNSSAQLSAMRGAVQGTVSDFDLMSASQVALAGATGELESELAKNIPALLEIAKASEKVNPVLGDTGFLFQSLTVGIKRLSPRLIDNTGLQIRLSESYKKLADARGKAVADLTAEEQQLALMNATIEAGNRLIEQAGGTTASATDAYNQFGASITNVKNEMAAWAHTIGSRVLTSINATIFKMDSIAPILTEHINGLDTSKMAWAAYAVEVVRSTAVAEGWSEEVQKVMLHNVLTSGSFHALAHSLGETADGLNLVEKVTYDVSNSEKSLYRDSWAVTGAMDEMAASTVIAEDALSGMNQTLTQSKAQFKLLQAGIKGAMRDANADFEKTSSDIQDNISELMDDFNEISGVELDFSEMQELRSTFESLSGASNSFAESFSADQASLMGQITHLSGAISRLSAEPWLNQDQILQLGEYEEQLANVTDVFNSSLNPAQQQAQQDISDYLTTVKELSEQPYVTDEQKEKLDEIIDSIMDAETAHADAAADHQKSSDLIVYGYLQEEVAALGAAAAAEYAAAKQAVAAGTEGASAQLEAAEKMVEHYESQVDWLQQIAVEKGILSQLDVDLINASKELVGLEKESGAHTGVRRKELYQILGLYEDIPPEVSTTFTLLGDDIEGVVDSVVNMPTDITVKFHGEVTGDWPYVETGAHGKTDTKPGQRATGGPVFANQPFIVGEPSSRGSAELFVPKTAGDIMSNSDFAGMTEQPISVQITVESISSDLDVEMLAYTVARRIQDKQRRG